MARIEISADGRFSSDSTEILFLLSLVMGAVIIGWATHAFILIPACLILFFLALKFHKRYIKAAFDDTNLYYKQKANEVIVPLAEITRISPTNWPIDRYVAYRISFADKRKSIMISPLSTKHFKLFLTRLREINPTAEVIENVWSLENLKG